MDEKYLTLIQERQWSGVRPVTRRMAREPITIGFDIETVNGIPYILGASSADLPGSGYAVEIDGGRGLDVLFEWLLSLQAGSGQRPIIAGAHRMAFDLGALIWHWAVGKGATPKEFTEQIEVHVAGGRLHCVLGSVCFATFRRGRHTIHFIDTWAYFKSSLEKSVRDLGLTEQKFQDFHGRLNPDGTMRSDWGMVRYPLSDIGPYCVQDAYMARLLLDQIVAWWREYEILPAISAPQMSARVFQKHFVQRRWVTIPQTVRVASMLSYHGGRNLFVGQPGFFPSLNAYDVNSAYTWAMTQMPDMTRGEWTGWAGLPEHESEWGFVCVTGTLPETRVPVLYSHGFLPLAGGSAVSDLWITSMEYAFLLDVAPGWQPDAAYTLRWNPDLSDPSDLSCYAQTMFDKRLAAPNAISKTLHKLLANSLYGKFIARTPNEDGTFYAGTLFYPPIASWITAMVRCRVMRSEFDYDVIHTATDGVMTARSMNTSSALGAMKFENTGPALIFRNKLYLHWGPDGVLKKHATHGFQGSITDLLRFVQGDDPHYTRNRLRGWGEARRDSAVPWAPVSLNMTLHTEPAVWERIRDEARVEPFKTLLADTLKAA